MNDFLRGTFGCLARGALLVLAFIFFLGGVFSVSKMGTSILFFILCVLCLAFAVGLQYWLHRR
jgi:hypothetical protein